jgi:hypothetical protein
MGISVIFVKPILFAILDFTAISVRIMMFAKNATIAVVKVIAMIIFKELMDSSLEIVLVKSYYKVEI